MKIPEKLHNYLITKYNTDVYTDSNMKKLETHCLVFDENLSKYVNYYNNTFQIDGYQVEHKYYYCKKCLSTVFKLIWPNSNDDSWWKILTCEETVIKNLLE